MDLLQPSSDLAISHIGPPLDQGRLPSVFYYALSASESLDLDPYNQPAVYLAKQGIRVFSIDLPAHGQNLNAVEALQVWADEFSEGEDLLAPLLNKAVSAIEAMLDKGLVIREKIGLMGLSRGGLIASHVAARFDVRATVGFAPMTELTYAKEFKKDRTNPKATQYNLMNHTEALCEKKIRYYIGNRDLRVGTDKCFAFIEAMANKAYEKGSRSPPSEMIISPSIGHLGHGTSKSTFEAGAHYLGMQLGAIK